MLFNHAAFRVRNSWRSAAGRPPGEAGQLRFASRWKKVQGARHAPCGRALRPGRETVPGTRADRFHPGCQRPRGPRDLGARHPHSPPAASDRGSLTSTALARLPRFWCAQRQKRGENPCPSLSLDLVRVGGMRPHGPQTWGEPKGRHSVTRPCSGGRGVGAQSEGATALPRRVQRRRSAACVLCVSLPNTSCGSTGRGRSHIRRRMLPSSAEEHEVDARVRREGRKEQTGQEEIWTGKQTDN